ncbi:MAG TPA: ATPase [Bacteroidetes bacterium]|nr:ATPase [Bacteroidota bacterium]HRR07759.1 ATP-grasp domain-containing protein [Rhodothermales bacterium]
MHQKTILCVASYFKGARFIQAAKAQGWRVLLLTSHSIKNEPWPWASIDDVFYIADDKHKWHMPDVIKGVSHLARKEKLDKIVPLDDLDVEKAAELREHLRIPGLGATQTRFFRDKLAMRERAQAHNILVPPFTHALHYQTVTDFASRVPGPWVVKPRSEAGSMGIKKVYTTEELWAVIHSLGDEQSNFLIEQFIPGDIFHVDSIFVNGKAIFQLVHQYENPPLAVTQGGGVFCSHNVLYKSEVDKALREYNKTIQKTMGLKNGVAHTEFIKAHADGQFYFLETAARVGGAHIADMIEASAGINLWEEWGKLECLHEDEQYQLPKIRKEYGGILITLSKVEHPDYSAYTDPEIVWRMHDNRYHAGLIVRSTDLERVKSLLDGFSERFRDDFCA